MDHKVTFKCEKGHEQTLTYKGDGFTREYVESACVLMAGGFLKPIGREMPGFPCGICGTKVSFEIEEVPGEKVDKSAPEG